MATQPWMFVRELETLEHPGIDTVLDRLETGGLRALVLGDLWFQDGTPGFAPHRELYVGLSRTPPEVPAGAEPRAAVVAEAIRRALARGFEVYLHDWGQG
ncbi:MAG: hypothetical protein FJX77_17630, partial [Armatimonadetes bacterium]|nr:hypothetical protein [Armatimonadota bacterium]